MKNLLSTNFLFLLMITLTSGCTEKRNMTSGDFIVNNEINAAHALENPVTISIDFEKSIIKWRGTKLGGIRGHEGTLEFEQGDLFFQNDTIIGGYFLVNMKSLEVTDIPDEQATAKNSLKTHLKSEFKTDIYPLSTFEIISVNYDGSEEVKAWGNLTMRGVTKNIQVPLKIKQITENNKMMTADITLDRTAWNIGEDGSWLEKRVVDNEFNLKINLIYK